MGYEADKYFKGEGDEKPSKPMPKIRQDDVREIKIQFRPKTIERAIFISIILLLLAYIIISNISYKCDCEATGSAATDSKLSSETKEGAKTQSTTQSSSLSENTTAPSVQNTSQTPQNSNANTSSSSSSSSATLNTSIVNATASALLTFGSSDVDTDGVKINEVSFNLKNTGGTMLRARVDVSWYDAADKGTMQDRVCGSTTLIIPAGQTSSGSITELTRKYTNPENSAETVALKAYDLPTGKLLDAKAVII